MIRAAAFADSLKTGGELAALCAVWWLADRLVTLLHWPLPGALIGLFALLLLFILKILNPNRLRRGSALLLRHLLLFFIPPMLVMLNYPDMWGWLGVKLAAIITLGTLMVMSLTALLVQFMLRFMETEQDNTGRDV